MLFHYFEASQFCFVFVCLLVSFHRSVESIAYDKQRARTHTHKLTKDYIARNTDILCCAFNIVSMMVIQRGIFLICDKLDIQKRVISKNGVQAIHKHSLVNVGITIAYLYI